VNKSDLIDAIAKSSDISKAAAGRALDATVDSIKKALKKGDTVSLVGFGTFKVVSALHAMAATPVLARPSRSRQQKCLNLPLAKALKML